MSNNDNISLIEIFNGTKEDKILLFEDKNIYKNIYCVPSFQAWISEYLGILIYENSFLFDSKGYTDYDKFLSWLPPTSNYHVIKLERSDFKTKALRKAIELENQWYDKIEQIIRQKSILETIQNKEKNSPLMCEHGNENPRICRCPSNCYCKVNTCQNK